MAITEAAAQALTTPLAAVRPVTWRKMFGGLGLYCEGTFFAVVDNDRLFFKVDAETEGAYEALGADGWVIEGDPPAPMPYREVPASILSDPGQLGEWIDAAVGVALRKKGGSSKKKKPIAEG